MIEPFLSLVRVGIGKQSKPSCSSYDWQTIYSCAVRHGLSAVILNGLQKLPHDIVPPKQLLLTWMGEVLQGYEMRYELYSRAITGLASFYNSHGYKMMILKGYACALDWPKPEHRPCGDIDIWLFGKQKEADESLLSDQGPGLKINNSLPHHTVFTWDGFTIENHYDFLNVLHHKSNVRLEKILKDLARDDTYSTVINGERVYLPSPNLNALFLLRHSMGCFASTSLSIRQLLDWAFFVENHSSEINWGWLTSIIDSFGMTPMFNIFNAICVDDLGFDSSLFPTIQLSPFLKDRVLKDIISPEFRDIEKGGIIRRAVFKYRRWKANGWKHELCYNESMLSAFWSGIKSHLSKPSTI